jgi:hypothetical protein
MTLLIDGTICTLMGYLIALTITTTRKVENTDVKYITVKYNGGRR